MNRFRKWLIHKLGGVTKEETILLKPIQCKTEYVKLEKIYATHYVDERDILVESDETYEKHIKDSLKLKLLDFIQPEFVYECIGFKKIIKAKLELPDKYINKGVK